MKVYRVVIIEDEMLVCNLLGLALSDSDEFEMVGEAHEGQSGLDLCAEKSPDVVILDMQLPGMKGPEIAMRLRNQNREIRLLALSSRTDRQTIQAAIKMGVNGYVVKKAPIQQLIEALRIVASGGQFFGETAIQVLAASEPRNGEDPNIGVLTGREVEVLREVASGLSIKEMSVALGISENTVKMHRQNVMRKLEIHDAVCLTHFAIRHGLISL